ncbi:MAG: type II toxin-antitoxin system VapC family toxin [Thermoflexales bacterium]|nr:type II toxin-antitoxin system VapC family toxin [Thermoflexales bacterium]
MSCYYLDASALVKFYVDEAGSAWIRALLSADSQPLVFTSRMTIIEMTSAFARRRREGSLTVDEFVAARDAFRGDCLDMYQVMPSTVEIVDVACDLLERHSLRAYDANHLATAHTAHQFLVSQGYPGLVFVSADNQLNEVAVAEGLPVDNPNDHPEG